MAKNSFNLSGVESGTIARTAVLVLALVNQVLTSAGKPILPIEDSDLSAIITSGITVGAALIAWWKNNSLTVHAQAADRHMKALKANSEENG